MMTAGDFVRFAMGRFAGLQELEAKTLYSSAMRFLYSKHKWTFLIVEGTLSTVAATRTVALPQNIDWGRDYFWWDPVNVCELPLIDRYAMMALRAYIQEETGRPEAICRGSLTQATETTVPTVLMEFGPRIPDDIYDFPYAAFKKPVAPTQDGAYPLWPEEFEDLIWRRMEIEFANNPRHPIRLSPDHVQEYRNRMWECIKRNDGGAEILRIKQLYNGRVVRQPFTNATIFPAAPGGSTDWGS